MLVATVGYQQASAKTGIKEATLRKWNERYKWKLVPTHALAVTNVTKPSDALQDVLADDSKQTRIGFSRAARKVASHVAEMAPEALTIPATALSASKWHGVAESIHGWNSEQKGSGVMPPLSIYSERTVVVQGNAESTSE
jgi:hypothetical protein